MSRTRACIGSPVVTVWAGRTNVSATRMLPTAKILLRKPAGGPAAARGGRPTKSPKPTDNCLLPTAFLCQNFMFLCRRDHLGLRVRQLHLAWDQRDQGPADHHESSQPNPIYEGIDEYLEHRLFPVAGESLKHDVDVFIEARPN